MFKIGQTVKARKDIIQDANDYSPRQMFAKKGELLKVEYKKHRFNSFDFYVSNHTGATGTFGVSSDEIEAS